MSEALEQMTVVENATNEVVSEVGQTEAVNIKVSNKKTSFFYVDLGTKFLKEQDHIVISGLGTALNTVVSIAEMLKASGLAEIAGITTDIAVKDQRTPKSKLLIVLNRAPNFHATLEAQEKQVELTKRHKKELRTARIASQAFFQPAAQQTTA